MRICFVSLFYSDDDVPPSSAPLLRALPAALAARGHEVSVVRVADTDAVVRIERVAHHFVRPRRALHQVAALAGAASRRPAAYFEWPRGLPGLLRSLRPDIVHAHGTQLHVALARLRRALAPDVRLTVHYHGGTPSRRLGLRRLQRRNLHRADAVLFTTAEQARRFSSDGMLADSSRGVLLVETSSDFERMDRQEARLKTGMSGRPVYLSAARLHPIKDPMTMLKGFERIVAKQPEAQLYLYYLSDELLSDMQAFVAQRPLLHGAVHFRGRLPRSDMEAAFNSADILLQASRREFSGCALLDAMACGVVPVISDLPSFRMIAGRHGAYFPAGDACALADAAISIPSDGLAARSVGIRDHFERELSFAAMAGELEAIYARILKPPS